MGSVITSNGWRRAMGTLSSCIAALLAINCKRESSPRSGGWVQKTARILLFNPSDHRVIPKNLFRGAVEDNNISDDW